MSDAEGYSWVVASAPSVGAFFERLAAYENTPPLFYALLAPLPHGDEAWLRVPALLPALACVPVSYCLVRPLLGTRAALLTALAVAVAPFHVSYSNYSRGFMLAALGVLLAAWAVARLAQGRRARWWWLYLGGAALALHAEYDALLFLAPLVALPFLAPLVGLPALGRGRDRRLVALLAVLPLVTLLPLAGEMLRGLDQLDVTKLTPPSAPLSPASLRDSLASLFVGTHGLAGSGAVRTLQLAVLLGALAAAALLLWRRPAPAGGASAPAWAAPVPAWAAPVPAGAAPVQAGAASAETVGRDSASGSWFERRLSPLAGDDRRIAFWLLAVSPALAVVLHALASIPGPEIFDSRYLVAAIPFACALLAAGIDALPWRWATLAAATCLLALAVAVVVQRHDRELHPDVAPAAELVASASAGTVLTNSPVAAYYLSEGGNGQAGGVVQAEAGAPGAPAGLVLGTTAAGAVVRLDRPFGLGNAEPDCSAACPRPLAIVEDARLPGGVRGGPDAVTPVGPIAVRVVP